MSPASPYYDSLAPSYDARWSRYLSRSLDLARAHLFVNPGQALLDVGCGTGLLLESVLEREPGVLAVGVDVSAGMLAIARGRLSSRAGLVRATAEKLPLTARWCDWLVSSSAFHYMGSAEAVLTEWHRVLRPGGRLVLVDWCGDFLAMQGLGWWVSLTERTPVHVYRAQELQDLLAAQGFDDLRIRRRRAGMWGLMAVTARRP